MERFDFDFSTNTVAPPANNDVEFDNATPSAVAHVNVSNMTNPGEDVHTLLLSMTVGTRLYVQDWNDHTLYAEFSVAAAPIDNTTWVDLPVTFVQAGGSLNNNQRITVFLETPYDLATTPPPTGGAGGWPTIDDVKNLLRLGDSTDDDAVVTSDLAAAIQWTINRVNPMYVPGSPTYIAPLPDPLFTVAQYEAARLYRRRDSVDGTIGWGDMGIVRVGPKDPDIETLIAPYLTIVLG